MISRFRAKVFSCEVEIELRSVDGLPPEAESVGAFTQAILVKGKKRVAVDTGVGFMALQRGSDGCTLRMPLTLYQQQHGEKAFLSKIARLQLQYRSSDSPSEDADKQEWQSLGSTELHLHSMAHECTQNPDFTARAILTCQRMLQRTLQTSVPPSSRSRSESAASTSAENSSRSPPSTEVTVVFSVRLRSEDIPPPFAPPLLTQSIVPQGIVSKELADDEQRDTSLSLSSDGSNSALHIEVKELRALLDNAYVCLYLCFYLPLCFSAWFCMYQFHLLAYPHTD